MSTDEVDEGFATGFAGRFAETWRTPDLAKHEAMWSDDIVLTQPMVTSLTAEAASFFYAAGAACRASPALRMLRAACSSAGAV
jgi:hypothetical protein